MIRSAFKDAKRVIIKLGTSSITHATGKLNIGKIDKIARIVSDLRNQGKEIIIVSSGAISAGVDRLHLEARPSTVSGRQACACVGQSALMEIYNKSFADYGYCAGQLLLTKDVLDKTTLKNNAQNTLNEMLQMNIIPVINENDSISVDEIRFGDNDILSAYVAILTSANLLILLTDTDGLYTDDPKKNPKAELVLHAKNLSKEFEDKLTNDCNKFGTGGMLSKVQAAKLASVNGIHTVIANALEPNNIYEIIDGKEIGTWFSGEKR